MNTINTHSSLVQALSIHVVGLGISHKAQLTQDARHAILNADWVVGSSRQFEVVADFLFENCNARPSEKSGAPQRLILPPLKELKLFIENLESNVKSIVILASGDPLFYGIGGWVKRNFYEKKIKFHTGVSSVQGACHALGLSLQDVNVLSLHGRPLEKIRAQLKSNRILVILTDQYSHPKALAQECLNAGFEDAQIHVCEALGYPTEKVKMFSVAKLLSHDYEFDALHVSVIETGNQSLNNKAPINQTLLTRRLDRQDFDNQVSSDPHKRITEFPGIADDAFFTDGEKGKGLITKREVRLNILSLMQPANGDVIWDVGAGCGSVAVELCYWNDKVQVHAIEHHNDRIYCLEKNKSHFGVVSNLHVIPFRAPQAFEGLPTPNKVFIGGSDGELCEMLNSIWAMLPVGGVLVASSVAEGSRQNLMQFYQRRQKKNDSQCETLQVAVSRGGELAGQLMYRPALPVTLFKWVKL